MGLFFYYILPSIISVTTVGSNKVEVSPVEKEEIVNFLGALDDDDDVQNVYTNANL